ncbi:hypothetical protein C922_00796 [Plasmodium inui San Antonio 1]|uniref:Myb-like domain-containing protein n=1 Tax=Plasmodium inui San Antonio 1 TaxID=1237626 RepID=W7AJU1_9APIC|nr:hypothetical protein C922_00796 [Plasmodium inui San Antonio 1]EUD69104.1 hypothetical protein C922_00796 [Plasmodium inui San Antonio 1]
MNDEEVSTPQGENLDKAGMQSGGELGKDGVTDQGGTQGRDELNGPSSMMKQEEDGTGKEKTNPGEDPLDPTRSNACTAYDNKRIELPIMEEHPNGICQFDTEENYPQRKDQSNNVEVEEGPTGNNSIDNSSLYVSHRADVRINHVDISQMGEPSRAEWIEPNGEEGKGGIPLNGATNGEGGAKAEQMNPSEKLPADANMEPSDGTVKQPLQMQPVCMRPSNTFLRNIVKKKSANTKNSIHNLNFANVNSMTFDPGYSSKGAKLPVGGSGAPTCDGSAIKNTQLPSGGTMTYSNDIVEEDLHHIYTLLNGELTRSPDNDKEIHRVKDEIISLHRNNPTEVLTLERCYSSVRANRKLIDVLFGLLGGDTVWSHTKWDSPFSQGAPLDYLTYESVNSMHQGWRQDVASLGAAQRSVLPLNQIDRSASHERGVSQNGETEEKKKKEDIASFAASQYANMTGQPLTTGGAVVVPRGKAAANQWNVLPPQEPHTQGGLDTWISPPAMMYGKQGEAERTVGATPWVASGMKDYTPHGNIFPWLNQNVQTKNEKCRGSPLDVNHYNPLSEGGKNSMECNNTGEASRPNQPQQPEHPVSNLYTCVGCKKVCTHVYYILKPNNIKKISYGVLDKCVWCSVCFNSSKYPSILNRSNFVKVNVPYSFPSNDWTVTEMEKLIDAIGKYKNNWEKISQSVGTRSPYECVFKFTSMPLSNPYFDIDNLLNINNVSLKSFKQNNTLLSLLSFICNYISPYIGAYAAKKIVDFILNKQRECVARVKEREEKEQHMKKEQWEKRENPELQTGEIKIGSLQAGQSGGRQPRCEDLSPAEEPKGEDPTEANSTAEKLPDVIPAEGAPEGKAHEEGEAKGLGAIAEEQHQDISNTGNQGAAPIVTEAANATGAEVSNAAETAEADTAKADTGNHQMSRSAKIEAERDDPSFPPGGNLDFVPLNINPPPKDSAPSTYILNEKDMQEIHNTIINASKKRARELAELERHNIRKLLKELALISTRKVKLKLEQYQYLQNYFDIQNRQMERKRARHGDEERTEKNEQKNEANGQSEQNEENWKHPQSEQIGQDSHDALDGQSQRELLGQTEPQAPDESQMAL